MIQRSAPVYILIGFAIAIAGLLASQHAASAQPDGIRALSAALGPTRPFEARLSGGFRHGASRGVTRGPADDADATLNLVIATIRKQAADDDSPRARRAAAIADLLTGRVDEAIGGLTILASRDPRDADSLNDLSAALLVRDRAEDAAGANDAAVRALAVRPSMPEALFNRALALERLGLVEQARDTWLAHGRVERSPAWKREAKTRLAALAQPAGARWALAREGLMSTSALPKAQARALVAAFPQQIRDWIADEGLPAWGRKTRDGSPGADDLLRICAELSAALAERGEPLTAEAVASLQRAPHARRLKLARAHDAYGRGREASDAYRFGEAKAFFTEAAGLMQPSDPFALWAELYLAIVAYQENRLNDAEQGLTRLGTVARQRDYLPLAARVDWVHSVLDSSRGRIGPALEAQGRSRAAYERLGESENLAIIHSLSAELFWYLGDASQSWQAQRRALTMLPHVQRPARRRTILFTAFTGALRDNRPAAALDFHNAFLDASRALGSDTAVAEALLHRARAYAQLQHDRDAAGDIDAARELLRRGVDDDTVRFLRAQLALVDAERLQHTDAASAKAHLDAALTYFRAASLDVWLARGYLSRAKLGLAAGERTAAERDLRDGIDVFERQRQGLQAVRLRIAYQDAAWGLFEELLDLQLATGRTNDAFELAERARARSLTDVASRSEVLSIGAVARSLPAGTVVLYYAMTSRGLAGWHLSRDSQGHVPLVADGLDAPIAAFRAAMERGRLADARAPGALLWARLIHPLLKGSGATTLVIVPDGPLHQIPFAAIPDDSGRPLIASRAITIAPSARTYVSALERPGEGSRNGILIAADPDRGATAVPLLPAAVREARGVAALYRTPTVLTGKTATRGAVLSRLASQPVVHLATHAIAHPEFPELSRFLFAPEAGENHMSTLLAEDLRDIRLSNAQLVVLAACDTAAGRTMRGEGVMSLARPFLVAGARTVVATLWPLDDRTSEALFTRLHRHYVAGASAAEALRAAQLEVLNDSSLPPGAWAAAIALGG